MSVPLIIFGAGGHATACANVAFAMGLPISGFVDPSRSDESHCGLPVAASPEAFGPLDAHQFFVAVGDNSARQRLRAQWQEKAGGLAWAILAHPSAVIGWGSELGPGSVAMPLAMIGPNCRIGAFCIVNSGASIDHDGRMEDYSSLAPGAVTGGNVSIGARSAICIGAIVKHGCKIGADSVLGGNAYLDQELPDAVVAYGNPARIVRPRQPGEPYL